MSLAPFDTWRTFTKECRQKFDTEKAKQLHPDKAASGDARAFRDALDAYRVLKDPGQRELSRREELGAWPGRGRELLRA